MNLSALIAPRASQSFAAIYNVYPANSLERSGLFAQAKLPSCPDISGGKLKYKTDVNGNSHLFELFSHFVNKMFSGFF